jgi:hypothetical protein
MGFAKSSTHPTSYEFDDSKESGFSKMKRAGMNDTENETVRFSVKPNPVLYALEFTRYALIMSTLLVGIPLLGSVIYVKAAVIVGGLVIGYVLVSPVLFIVAIFTARHLMFIVTDRRAIVRVSSGRMTTNMVSIAIEAVQRIQITSFGATYGSVYLSYDETLDRRESEGSEPGYLQPGATRRVRNELTGAPAPIERVSSIWGPVNFSGPFKMRPLLFGFYGFKGFDEFANILSEQQRLRAESQRGRSW